MKIDDVSSIKIHFHDQVKKKPLYLKRKLF